MTVQATISPDPIKANEPWTITATGCPVDGYTVFDVRAGNAINWTNHEGEQVDDVVTLEVPASSLDHGTAKVTVKATERRGVDPLEIVAKCQAKVT